MPSPLMQLTCGYLSPSRPAVRCVARMSTSTDQTSRPDSAQANVLWPSLCCPSASRILPISTIVWPPMRRSSSIAWQNRNSDERFRFLSNLKFLLVTQFGHQ